MRKISLSSQLVLIFVITFIISISAFLIASASTTINLVESEVYTRLQSYSQFMDGPMVEGDFPDLEVAFYIKNNQEERSRLKDFVTAEDISLITSDALKIRNQSSDQRFGFIVKNKYINTNSKKLYYVYETRDNSQNFKITITNDSYASRAIQNNMLINSSIFLGSLLFISAVLIIWSTTLVKRLRNIQNHILSLPRNKYEEKYVDDGLDEVGMLSNSVEHMRLEIYKNEKIKQEMLQNLSHDFKTPIAVIKTYAEAIDDGVEDITVGASKIIEQADILKHKVNKLLQYNSLEYLTKDKEFEDVAINEIIRDIVMNYKYQTDLTFDLDLEDDVTFKGYRENWYTVIDNIVDNAKRYAKSTIKIVLKKDYLRIYNDGEPISEEFINNSFKPYEKGSKGQFGLGMSIAQKTIYFFGMKLIVKNENVGVSFIIKG